MMHNPKSFFTNPLIEHDILRTKFILISEISVKIKTLLKYKNQKTENQQ